MIRFVYRLILWALLAWPLVLQAQTPETPATEAAGAEPADEPEAPTAAPTPAPEPPPYPNREFRDMSLLAQSQPEDQVLWVEGPEGEVLALYYPAISAEPVGAVLLVQDQDLNARWPSRLEGLRRYLPEYGWSTLLVSLPAPDPLPVPARPPEPVQPLPATSGADDAEGNDGEAKTDDNSGEQVRPETEEVFDDSKGEVADVAELQQERAPQPEPTTTPVAPAARRADQRLAQALDALHDRGQFNIVLLAEGSGAVRAARLAESVKYQGFRALVLLDARNQLPGEAGDVLALLKEMPVPVLDIRAGVHVSDPLDSEARRQAAKRAGLAVYQPLLAPAYEPGQQRLYKRIRGFIDRHAQGVKVDNAAVIDNP